MTHHSKNSDEQVTFADVFFSKRYRKAQNDFLNQMDMLIDWRPIRTLINKKYTKQQNAVGVPDHISVREGLLVDTSIFDQCARDCLQGDNHRNEPQ